MATQAQILANQQNSKLSTGPRTPEGKAASSHNHLVHGLSAADPVLPTEDRNQFIALLTRYKSENAPENAHQEFLINQMAGARWKLDRVERLENEMFATLDDPAQAFTDEDAAKKFARLEKYRASLERTYHRCARELRATRREQFKPKSSQSTESSIEELLRMLQADDPSGSVPSSGTVETASEHDATS